MRKKLFAMLTALVMVMSFGLTSMAATVGLATIDTTKTGSITIYKYDKTTAESDGIASDSYVAAGEVNTDAENTYADYAIEGVEFTYLKVADIATHSVVDSTTGAAAIQVIYGLNSITNTTFVSLGLDTADAIKTENGLTYYTSDTLIDMLAEANQNKAVATKNTLENFVTTNSGTAMPLTSAEGKTSADGLPVGLYLVVETRVPENVTVTTAPFFVSIPMTDLEGEDWVYDVTVYPKNLTGMPDLKKEVAEVTSANEIVYSTAVSASMGDVLAYRITSTLPFISSQATYLTTYTFVDTMDKGLSYVKNDVTLTWKTEDGTEVAVWDENDGFFTVSYGTDANGGPVMTIKMTADGLKEINPAYSRHTLVIDYRAKLNSDDSVVLGDGGNGNVVVLEWRRTSMTYFDTLTAGTNYKENPSDPTSDEIQTPAAYTFGMKIVKLFSDNNGDATAVKFKVKNATDGYYLTANNPEPGLYYITGTVSADEAAATVFSPAADGVLRIYGLEADSYVMTELETDGGYTLLKDAINIVLTANRTSITCSTEQCSHATHEVISASATVNGDAVTMEGRDAIVPLSIVNERGYEVPATGDGGTFMLPLIGILGACGLAIVSFSRKREAA